MKPMTEHRIYLLPEITPERAAEIVRRAFDLSPGWGAGMGVQRLYAGSQAFTRHLERADVDAALAELLAAALPILTRLDETDG